MKKLYRLGVGGLLLLQAGIGQTQTCMFRGGPEHTGVAASASALPLTSLYWTVATGGPVRASVSYDERTVYIGCASGDFYALDKASGRRRWRLPTGEAIHSTAAVDSSFVYFVNNRQTLYAVAKASGKIAWQLPFPDPKKYDWGFDYFYSSPMLVNGFLLVGSNNGCVYKVNARNGKVVWKYRAEGLVRSTPAVSDGIVYFGDTEGSVYAVALNDAKEVWKFATEGHGLRNEDFGFDRRAVISSPVVANDKVIVGGRDGFLYAIDKSSGKERWRVNHNVSWVISTPAVKDSVVVTGTSDGRFVQAVNLQTGREIWKFRTNGIVWSSPLICNGKVYSGSNEGLVYCLDLHSGRRLSSFQADGKIWASPVVDDSLLFVSTDKGTVYALKPSAQPYPQSITAKKMVFYEADLPASFYRKSVELKAKEFLNGSGYQTINTQKLTAWFGRKDSALHSVVVFASNYFPADVLRGNERSLLRQYLNNGGRVVLLGTNPVLYDRDSATKAVLGFVYPKADSVLGLRFPFSDLRSLRGIQPAFATAEGKRWGTQGFWTGFLPLSPAQVDVVLGMDETHLASAWVKRYHPSKASGLIQLWVDAENETDFTFVVRVAEHGLDKDE